MSNNQISIEYYINNLITILGDEICNRLTIDQTNRISRLSKEAKDLQREQIIGLLEWMNEIAKNEPMRLETDKDDIVDQYLKERFGIDPIR